MAEGRISLMRDTWRDEGGGEGTRAHPQIEMGYEFLIYFTEAYDPTCIMVV